MSELQGLDCCGINELASIGGDDSPEATLISLVDEDCKAPYLLFSSPTPTRKVGRDNPAQNLADYITSHKLGDVVKLPVRQNPNSQNFLHVFMFMPNRKQMETWRERKVRADKKAWGGQFDTDPVDHYFDGRW